MDSLIFIQPTKEYKNQIMNYKKAFQASREVLHGSASLRNEEKFEDWFEQVKSSEDRKLLPEGFVPYTQFIGVRKTDNKVVAMANVRHELNEWLIEVGGHVGYSVHPEERQKGYAKYMLAESLKFLKTINVTRALVTCDEDNIGSKRTILSQGGQFESVGVDPNDGKQLDRYWIEIE